MAAKCGNQADLRLTLTDTIRPADLPQRPPLTSIRLATGLEGEASSPSERNAALADETYAVHLLDAPADERSPASLRMWSSLGLASGTPPSRGFTSPRGQAQHSQAQLSIALPN